MSKQKILLDTDIGDDIDDVLALMLILNSPNYDLRGVTTVFKNTYARTKQARTILKLADRTDIPVAAGCGASISPRNEMPFSSLEAYLTNELPIQDGCCLPENELPPIDPRHGVDFIIDTIEGGKGDIAIITIGAMTNIALAISKEPRIRRKIPKIVSMAGAFDRHKAEWNILCDPVAAALVLDSGIPVDMIGLDVTTKIKFQQTHLQAIARDPHPLIVKLHETITLWKALGGHLDGLPILHDPLAVETFTSPDLVTWRQGIVSVELNGSNTYGYTRFSEVPDGPHRYAATVQVEKAANQILNRLLSRKTQRITESESVLTST